MNDNETEILAAVLDEFAKLAAIPRPSGHEEAVSNFLRDYLTKAGFAVTQDAHYNIIADKPATEGFSNVPRTVLQAHMDMVCTAADGVAFNPLTDSIKLVRDGEYLRADGTSLGADDGIGVAVGIYALKNFAKHGPLRLIVTTGEETGMGGAALLEDKYLLDAAYLINCDSENLDELIVGCAGGAEINFSRRISWQIPQKKTAWRLEVTGLKGGHSGERIGDGRGNALNILAGVLNSIDAVAGTELASIDGGKALNVIPDYAAAVFTTDAKESTVRYIVDVRQEHFRDIYGAADPDLEVTLTAAAMPDDVMDEQDKTAVLRLLYLLPIGVLGMSQTVAGLVETSANLGTVRTTRDETKIGYFPRSSLDAMLGEFGTKAQLMAQLLGVELNNREPSPAWHEQKDSRLARIVSDIFAAQNGKNMRVTAIHAGLECGYFRRKNKSLDIVSVGVTTKDIHSPKERLLLSSVVPQVKLIKAALEKIAEEGREA